MMKNVTFEFETQAAQDMLDTPLYVEAKKVWDGLVEAGFLTIEGLSQTYDMLKQNHKEICSAGLIPAAYLTEVWRGCIEDATHDRYGRGLRVIDLVRVDAYNRIYIHHKNDADYGTWFMEFEAVRLLRGEVVTQLRYTGIVTTSINDIRRL